MGVIGLFCMNLIIPVDVILVGAILKKNPVQDRASHIGYNTPASRKSQEHWNYAQRIAPDIFIRNGIILAVVEILLALVIWLFKIIPSLNFFPGIIFGVVYICYLLIHTDRKITKHFTE